MAYEILQGDCVAMMKLFVPDASVDAIVTDPPYELGFMGKGWDSTGIANSVDMWREALRVLKPGGHLLAFSGTRTYHRMVCAIEDAGFEIRDQIGWAYGSGFPKSHNGPWGGTALKPAWEPIVLARKPLIGTVEANWRERGTGALNIDGCRIGSTVETWPASRSYSRQDTGAPSKGTQDAGAAPPGRWPANLIHDGSDEVLAAFPQAPGQLADASSSSSSSRPRNTQHIYGAMKRGNGREGEATADSDNEGGVGFKMKPDARRLDAGSAARFFYCAKASRSDRDEGLDGFALAMPANAVDRPAQRDGTAGSTGRGSRSGPRANIHPTVKPTDLMRYLCRLIAPPGGLVLDPFLGSGSTGKAAVLEGFDFLGCEMQPEYITIAEARIAHAYGSTFKAVA